MGSCAEATLSPPEAAALRTAVRCQRAARGFILARSRAPRSRPGTAPLSAGEEALAFQLRAVGLPLPEREYRFDPVRRWRFDFAWPGHMLAVEIDGVTRGRGVGAHQRCDGLERDYEKGNSAQLAGWTVLHFTPRQVRAGVAIAVIKEALR
jgi:very-short-patch-repair endonuclease